MKTKVFFFIIMVAGISLNATAQKNDRPFGLELNAGPGMVINNSEDVDLKPVFGFEASLYYNFLPHTGIYAGWGWNRFNSHKSFAGDDACFEQTGYVFGLQFRHPLEGTSLRYYIKAGGNYKHIELEPAAADDFIDSGHGFGWELEGGIDIPMNDKWYFSPALKFSSLTRSLEYQSVNRDIDMSSISLNLGFVRTF